MPSIEGFVLAGGQSRRMGENKAVLRLGERSLAERAANVLAEVTGRVVIVGHSTNDPGSFLSISDEIAGTVTRGSLVGLYTALRAAGSEWAAVLACDLPFVNSQLFLRMLALLELTEAATDRALDAVVVEQPDGIIQPLCGLYRVEACLPAVEQMLAAKKLRLQDLIQQLRTTVLEFPAYSDIAGSETLLLNVNTPADFLAATEYEAKQGMPGEENIHTTKRFM